MKSFILSLLFSLPLFAQTVIQLDENYLSKAAQKGSPQLDQIEAAFLQVQLRRDELKQDYAPELFGQGAYAETNERAIIRFQPVFSPIAQAQLGVRQRLQHGFETSVSIVTDQRSAAPTAFTGRFKDVTTTTLKFTMQMDLWKNLLGRVSETQLASVELDQQRATLEKEIQQKVFSISLRRIYWALVANQESVKISTQLLKTAERQLAETQMRFKNAVAEADEVARHEAQVASRKGTILYLQYQRETLLKQLRNLLPELGTVELALGNYNVEGTINEVLACTATISRERTVPYHFTKYDEVVALMRKVRENLKTINARYSDVDVKLFGTVKATGVSSEETGGNASRGSYGGSIDDIESTNRTGYEVGLLFTMPLGESREKTKKTKELYDEKRLLASISNSEIQVQSTHAELTKSLSYLNEVVRTQKVNTEKLELRLRLMQKKYMQARVSVNDLITDQDALLSSQLTTIETQLQILNTIFDYLMVFTDTPCTFNRK